MLERNNEAEPTAGLIGEDEVTWNFLNAARRISRGRRTLLFSTASGLVLSGVIAFLLPITYQATAVFIPPPSLDTTAMPSASLLLKQSDPSDMYLGLLASRSVADDVIDHLGLMNIYHAKQRTDGRSMLARDSNFKVNKDTLISVVVTAKDPTLAAAIANGYLAALYRENGAMVASSNTHRREFLEQQLEQQKDALSAAEIDLKKTQEATGLVLPQGEAMEGLAVIAQLQSEIGNAETGLAGTRLQYTEGSPQITVAEAQLAQLRAQLKRQQASSNIPRPGDGLASTANLPGLTLEYLRKSREVKINESIYDALMQQYEKARIAEADTGPELQIVDHAVVPERKSGPPRKLIIIGGFLLGFLGGIGYLLISEPIRRVIQQYSETQTYSSAA